jgi:hypothetical protein
MKRTLPLVVIASALAAASWAQSDTATTWKWRDAAGRITVSDTPPPASVAEKDILLRPGTSLRLRPAAAAASGADGGPKPTAAGAAATGARVDPELEARRRKATDEQQTQQKAQQKAQDERDAAVRAENCSRARGHLVALEDGQRMTRTNAQGEREVLDDKGRAEEMQRARAIIASDCK